MVRLGDYVEIKTGKLDANQGTLNGKYPFFTCSKEVKFIDKFAFDGEYVLVAGNGDLNVKYFNGKFNAYQRTYAIKCKSKLVGKYLYYFLESYIDKLREQSIGGVIKYIKLGNLTDAKIPLPPLETQKHIAQILDDAAALRDKTAELLKEYDLLAQSIFLEMFGDPVLNPKGWGKQFLNDTSTKITDGEHGTVKRIDSGKMYLMARNIGHQGLILDDISYISEKDHLKIYKRCNAEEGDLLLVCVGATIGRCCLTPEIEDFSLARSVALIKPNELINSYFLLYQFKNQHFQNQIMSKRNTSAQAGLYTGQIKKLQVIVPPIELQNQFAEKIILIEQQKELAKQELKESEDLFNCLLQKAFKGELV